MEQKQTGFCERKWVFKQEVSMEKSMHIKFLLKRFSMKNRHIRILIIHLDCIISKEKILRMKLNPSIKIYNSITNLTSLARWAQSIPQSWQKNVHNLQLLYYPHGMFISYSLHITYSILNYKTKRNTNYHKQRLVV